MWKILNQLQYYLTSIVHGGARRVAGVGPQAEHVLQDIRAVGVAQTMSCLCMIGEILEQLVEDITGVGNVPYGESQSGMVENTYYGQMPSNQNPYYWTDGLMNLVEDK